MYDLYKFYYGIISWMYTNNKSAVISGSDTYNPVPIERSEVVYEEAAKNLELTLSYDVDPLKGFRLHNTIKPIWLRVQTVDGSNTYTIFLGQVVSCSFDKDKRVKVNVMSIETSLKSKVPTNIFQPTCRWELYGAGCQVNKTSYKTRLVYGTDNLSINGKDFTSNQLNLTSDYYTFGTIETGEEKLLVVKQTVNGSNVTLTALTSPVSSIVVGTIIDFYSGCKLTIDVCNTKFNNSVNFGGYPYVPYRNPFLGIL